MTADDTTMTGRADILRAHARLAAINPGELPERLLPDVLEALLTGAGHPIGLALDPKKPEEVAASGFSPNPASIGALCRSLAKGNGEEAIPTALLHDVFAGEDAEDPRAIPVTAEDDTLVLLLLPGPPLEPLGFASVVSHAASILARVRMSEKVREAGFELKMRLWELESLYDVGLSIAGTLDLESLADEVLMKSVSLLNAQAGTLILKDGAGEGRFLTKEIGVQLLCSDHGDIPFPLDGVIMLNDRAHRPLSLAGAPAEKLLGVPIRSDGEHVGVLFVADKENRAGGVDDFNESDKRVLKLFGNQAAIALENARLHREALEKERMDREIELAATIQATILPTTLPPAEGLELAGGNRPTRQVGGDYFNVFPLPDGRTAFCVADVSGKGIPAALLVSTVHACLHLLIEAHADDLAGLASRLNRHLVGFSSTRKFVTLFFCVYDPVTHELRYVNAGHNPAILLSGDSTTLLPSGGVPVGMLPSAVHREGHVLLQPGDLLLLYSDGITEALDAGDEEFDLPRLIDLLKAERGEKVSLINDRIFSAVARFTTGVAQYDDQTVLVARVL